MARLNYRQIKHDYDLLRREQREQEVFDALEQEIEDGNIRASDFSIREAFTEMIDGGDATIRDWQRGHEVNLMEAGSAVDAFSKTTERIVQGRVMEGFQDPAFIGDRLVTTETSTAHEPTILPGIIDLGDDSEEVGILQDYPEMAQAEDWIERPGTVKKGWTLPIAKEHIMNDRNGLIMRNGNRLGFRLGYSKEKRIIACVTGTDGATYTRRERSAVSVYDNNTGDHNWDNLLSNTLVDWTSVETMEIAFENLVDPYTGETIIVMPRQVLVPGALRLTARRIVNATHIEHVDNQANAATIRTQSTNPLDNYEVISSPLVFQATASTSTWFGGDFPKGFTYIQNWPVTVTRAPAGNVDEFKRDVAIMFKASERGVCSPDEPRYAIKNT